MLGGGRDEVINAVSHSWIDNGALRAYRHAPNTGPRKSWAAGDACRRAVIHALNAIKGEDGCPSALTVPTWGFYDVGFGASPFAFERPFGTYVMENILFKISFPAEFHAQTAVECAMALHGAVKAKLNDGGLDQIERIELETQEAGLRIIDKTGPLANYADRDHCLQYMVAVPLIFGRLTAGDYDDTIAADPRIDMLRDKMVVRENPRFTAEYHDPDKAIHRQLGPGVLQGRHFDRKGFDRLPGWPSQTPCRRHPPAHGQVRSRDQGQTPAGKRRPLAGVGSTARTYGGDAGHPISGAFRPRLIGNPPIGFVSREKRVFLTLLSQVGT